MMRPRRMDFRTAKPNRLIVKAPDLIPAGEIERFQAVPYDTYRHFSICLDEVGELERGINVFSPGFNGLV